MKTDFDEPFCLNQATKQKPGAKKGALVFGKGGSSSSTAQTTNNVDKRWVVGEGATALALDNSFLQATSETNQSWQTSLSDARNMSTNINDSRDLSTYLSTSSADTTNSNNTTNSTTNVSYLDAGAVAGGFDVAKSALQTNKTALELSNATLSSGYSKLLDTAEKMYTNNQDFLAGVGNVVSSAFQTGAAEKSGSFDNKTLLTLAALAAGVAVVVTIGGKK